MTEIERIDVVDTDLVLAQEANLNIDQGQGLVPAPKGIFNYPCSSILRFLSSVSVIVLRNEVCVVVTSTCNYWFNIARFF